MLKLDYTNTQVLSTGDFDARVENGMLLLPTALAPIVQPTGMTNANELFSAMLAAPEAFMTNLNWTRPEFDSATDKLRTQLRGHVPDDFLDYDVTTAPKFSMGALPPQDPPVKTGYKVPPRKP